MNMKMASALNAVPVAQTGFYIKKILYVYHYCISLSRYYPTKMNLIIFACLVDDGLDMTSSIYDSIRAMT